MIHVLDSSGRALAKCRTGDQSKRKLCTEAFTFEILEPRVLLTAVSFSDAQIIDELFVPGPLSVAVADIDSDGDNDLVAAFANEDKIAWLENLDGKGTFSERRIVSEIAVRVTDIAVADVDNDGDADVIFYTSRSADDPSITIQAGWHENLDGRGTFGPKQSVNTEPLPAASRIDTADLDGDGTTDLIAWGRSIYWWANPSGMGDFVERPPIHRAGFINDVVPFDLENDGDLDIIATDGSTLQWHQNIDDRDSFGGARVIKDAISVAQQAIATGDINGNGYPDILTSTGNGTIWYAGSGANPIFEDRGALPGFSFLPAPTTNVEVVDLDVDGDLDVISLSSLNGFIWWNENLDGEGTFATPQLFGSPKRESLIIAADLNGDLVPDIISNAGDEAIVWFENLRGGLVLGDMDQNGLVDAFDVDDFELALSNREGYLETYPSIDPDVIGDLNGDGVLNAIDTAGFERLLAQAAPPDSTPLLASEQVDTALAVTRDQRVDAGTQRGVLRAGELLLNMARRRNALPLDYAWRHIDLLLGEENSNRNVVDRVKGTLLLIDEPNL